MLNTLPKHVELFLQGKQVGHVEVNRFADSWHFGSFQPHREFSEFAPLFGEWSLLIHAEEKESQVSQATLDELAKVERAIDSLRAELVLPTTGERLSVEQINIDGDMVELKLSEHPTA
jgi:hypothetical protein